MIDLSDRSVPSKGDEFVGGEQAGQEPAIVSTQAPLNQVHPFYRHWLCRESFAHYFPS
jgi:hypothetical protein